MDRGGKVRQGEMNIQNALTLDLWSQIIKTSPFPTMVIERSTKIALINEHGLEILGIKENFPKKVLNEHLPAESVDALAAMFNEMVEKGIEWKEIMIGVKVTGFKLKLLVARIGMIGTSDVAQKECFLLIFKTGLKEPLDPHGMTMASIGEFAAGVAHELNTPLANISLIAENLIDEMDSEYVKKELGKILVQVEFSAKIVKDLLAFSRKDEPTFELVDLNDVIKDAIENMKFERIFKVDIEMKDDLPRVKADPFQIQEVIMNILKNAKESMNDGGEIHIRSKVIDGWVEINIEDTGHGVPKEIMNMIFQPFYTTKPHGKGVGLGLAICKRIITNHKGELVVRNNTRRGSTFTIRLPRVT